MAVKVLTNHYMYAAAASDAHSMGALSLRNQGAASIQDMVLNAQGKKNAGGWLDAEG